MAKIILFVFQLVLCGKAFCQHQDFYLEGLVLEKNFKVEAALEKYESAIHQDPQHAMALIHASRMLSNIGGRLPKKEEAKKITYYKKAIAYSEQSIKLKPADPESHLAYIISLGLQSEISTSPQEKVRYAQIIHREATRILQIDSSFAEAYFVLGKWHHELAQLNWVELMACKLFFGGFPEEISLDRSLNYFIKANNYKPNYILFLYGLASAQHSLGENDKSIQTLQKALSLPLSEPDDITRKDRCEALLNEIIQ